MEHAKGISLTFFYKRSLDGEKWPRLINNGAHKKCKSV